MILRKNNDDYNYNYDDEDEKKSSGIINFLNKYKIIIVLSAIILGIIIALSIMNYIDSNKVIENYLILNGDETVIIYRGTDYVEPGFEAYNSKKVDLSSFVEIKTTLNTEKIGTYEITYTLYDIVMTRTIEVIANPNEKTEIILKTSSKSEDDEENDKIDTDVYLLIGEEYIEPGYEVVNSLGKDLQDEVTITGTVDTSKQGVYELTYSLIDPNEELVSVTRKVIVMDIKITLSKNTEEYTNKNVSISIKVEDDYFDYLELPNKNKTEEKNYTYIVSDNGIYTFNVYNEKGFTKNASIDIKNIDKIAPSGSCSGSYKDGVSTINITASDNVGIKNYKVNDKYYTSNKININQELLQVSVTISDLAGNTKNVSCTLEDKNEVIISDKSITFSYKYVSDGTTMPYALYTPSTASKGKPIPLIVWLHGSGEVASSESTFKNSGLLNVLNSWELEGFNAYVLCPHLSKNGYSNSWANDKSKNNLNTLLDKITKQYNIDESKIVVSGHSLGAVGVPYIAYQKPNYFSAMAVLSGYDLYGSNIDISTLKYMPIWGFVGTPAYGEDNNSYSYMIGKFSNTFGSDKVTIYNTSHGNVPRKAFTEDKNNDNKSDLIEWMLTRKK